MYPRRQTQEDSPMNLFIILAFLFFIGSVSGWFLEVFYRRFFSAANPERKWINPGFCTGPYIPLYGFGLCILYLLASIESSSLISSSVLNKLILFLFMAVTMTGIEYLAGIYALKYYNLRLWDYSREWGNIRGIICPKFSVIWSLLGAAYYFLIHPRILNALRWLSLNLAFSFVIGLFFGVFIIDASNSMQLVVKLKQFAVENDVIVRYEHLKLHIRNAHEARAMKYHFFSPFRSDLPLSEHLKEMHAVIENHKDELRKKLR